MVKFVVCEINDFVAGNNFLFLVQVPTEGSPKANHALFSKIVCLYKNGQKYI